VIELSIIYCKKEIKQDKCKDNIKWILRDYDLIHIDPPILILTKFLQLLIVSFLKSIISHWQWYNNAICLKQYSIDSWHINLNQRMKIDDKGD